jgi:TolA-binding protein
MRSLSISVAIAALSLLPTLGSAAPATPPAGDAQVLLAQGGPPPGWWEQEGHADELRQRYWQLPPPQAARYNQLEYQVRQLQFRIDQLRREQRRILRWGY